MCFIFMLYILADISKEKRLWLKTEEYWRAESLIVASMGPIP